MPPGFFSRYNLKNVTPEDIFITTHKDMERSSKWLNKTLGSGSVVATLIATVAFATATSVPGGFKENSSHPTLAKEPTFLVFAISSLIALGYSVMAVVMFLFIQLTSRFLEKSFYRDLPRKLLIGFLSLFMSIVSMLVSFCAANFFAVKDQLPHAALPIYVLTCLPVTVFALAQSPLYFDLLGATIKHVPQRSYKSFPLEDV